MKKFCLRAHIEFEAENLGHAARLLEDHFRGVVLGYVGGDDDDILKPLLSSLDFTGELDIRPLPAQVAIVPEHPDVH